MLPAALTDRLAEVAEDNESGASYLIAEAAGAVADHLALDDAAAVRDALPDLIWCVAQAQPSMAPFWNFANALALAGEAQDDDTLCAKIAQACEVFHDGSPRRLAALSNVAAGELQPYAVLATHSLSHTVHAAVMKLYEQGGLDEVFCTAGEPMCEGRGLAGALHEAGVPVTYTTDAGVYTILAHAEAVLLGADAVTIDGLRNKTGSLGLAAAANYLGIATYALCDTTKFMPHDYADWLADVDMPPEEVWEHAPADLNVVNYYFDLTPLDLLTGIITEYEVLRPHELRERLARLPVAAYWDDRGPDLRLVES